MGILLFNKLPSHIIRHSPKYFLIPLSISGFLSSSRRQNVFTAIVVGRLPVTLANQYFGLYTSVFVGCRRSCALYPSGNRNSCAPRSCCRNFTGYWRITCSQPVCTKPWSIVLKKLVSRFPAFRGQGDHHSWHPSNYVRVSQVVSFLHVFWLKFCMPFLMNVLSASSTWSLSFPCFDKNCARYSSSLSRVLHVLPISIWYRNCWSTTNYGGPRQSLFCCLVLLPSTWVKIFP
jgi:hypothetical protein